MRPAFDQSLAYICRPSSELSLFQSQGCIKAAGLHVYVCQLDPAGAVTVGGDCCPELDTVSGV